MTRVDIKAIIKDLNKDELKYNIKESRFSKGYECPNGLNTAN